MGSSATIVDLGATTDTPATDVTAEGAALRRQVPARDIVTRRISFEYPPDSLPRHFVGDDLVMSHVVAVLSAMFPNGEDFFVQSVRNYRNEVSDPELKKQVARFIGQEAMHGREHRTFNERLGALGFATGLVDRGVEIGFKRVSARVLPKSVQLAVTAALEHYTATLAEVLMSDTRAQQMLTVDEVRDMLLWHALEESEHKAVAFDVFQAVSGNDFLRARVMDAVTAGFVLALLSGTAVSLIGDPATRDLGRLYRSLRRLRQSPFLARSVLRRLRDYNRADFHPDDNDATDLLAQWRAELFGDTGRLADHLR